MLWYNKGEGRDRDDISGEKEKRKKNSCTIFGSYRPCMSQINIRKCLGTVWVFFFLSSLLTFLLFRLFFIPFRAIFSPIFFIPLLISQYFFSQLLLLLNPTFPHYLSLSYFPLLPCSEFTFSPYSFSILIRFSPSTFIESTVPLLSFSSLSPLSKFIFPSFPISSFYLYQSSHFPLFIFPIFIPLLPFFSLSLIRRTYLSNNRLKISAKKTSLSAPSCSTCSSQSHVHRLVGFLCHLLVPANNNFGACFRERYLILYFNLFIRLIPWLTHFAASFRGLYLFFYFMGWWTDWLIII